MGTGIEYDEKLIDYLNNLFLLISKNSKSEIISNIVYSGNITSELDNSDIPIENIKGWNWGAFWLTWLWGIGNKSWLTFWALIPYFNILWMFVCGFKGNEWAWKNKNWTNFEEFTRVQKKWATIANILAVTLITIVVIIMILGMGE